MDLTRGWLSPCATYVSCPESLFIILRNVKYAGAIAESAYMFFVTITTGTTFWSAVSTVIHQSRTTAVCTSFKTRATATATLCLHGQYSFFSI